MFEFLDSLLNSHDWLKFWGKSIPWSLYQQLCDTLNSFVNKDSFICNFFNIKQLILFISEKKHYPQVVLDTLSPVSEGENVA